MNLRITERLLVATSEPRMILILLLKFGLLEPQRYSSALSLKLLIGIFQGFSSLSYLPLHFYNSG